MGMFKKKSLIGGVFFSIARAFDEYRQNWADTTGRSEDMDWNGSPSLGEEGATGWNKRDAWGLGIGDWQHSHTPVADGHRTAEAARRQWCRSNQAGKCSVQSVA